MTRLWTDDELRKAVKNSNGITEVVKQLYGTISGGYYSVIWRRIGQLSINTDHFSSERSSPRKNDSDFLCRGKHVKSQILRRLLMKYRQYICEVCGNHGVHQDKKLVLQVDHADGDRLNNVLGNLRWLCPNCHSQTTTYGRQKSKQERKSKKPTIRCSKCRCLFEVDGQYQAKLRRGQTNFFCSLKCASGAKIDDDVIWRKYRELGSVAAVAKELELHWTSIDFRIKAIRNRLEGKTRGQQASHTGSRPVSGSTKST